MNQPTASASIHLSLSARREMSSGVAPPSPSRRRRGRARRSTPRQPIGIVFLLGLLWLLFDLGRPPTPPGVPLLISGVMFVDWLFKRNKQWSPQSPCWLVLLAVMASGVLFAPNTYAAAFLTRMMMILFLGVCLPLQAMVTTVRHLRLWIYALIAISVYVGAWAATHGGLGPMGAAGQDENYVAALMAMAAPLSYFSMFAERRLLVKLLLGSTLVVFLAAVALAQNPSRGGFLALCVVAIYAMARSPRKMLGLGVLAAGGLALFIVAGPAFWAEIRTTTDTSTGTGDMRLELWAAGARMWKANPILGVGAGNFIWTIGQYQTNAQLEKFGRVLTGSVVTHSLPVECIAELGSAGAIATLILLGFTWRGLGRVVQRIAPSGRAPVDPELAQLRCYADAMRGSILGLTVAGIFLSLLYYSHLWVLLAVGSAVPFVFRRTQRQVQQARLALGHPDVGRGGRAPFPLPLVSVGGADYDGGHRV